MVPFGSEKPRNHINFEALVSVGVFWVVDFAEATSTEAEEEGF